MMHRVSSRALLLAAVTLLGVHAVQAQSPQAPQRPAPPAPQQAATLVLRPPPALAPAPARAPLRSVAPAGPATLPTPMVAPARTSLPDSITRGRGPMSLVTPTPLVREAPRRRVRQFGAVRNDVALQPAVAGATGRCKDGTYLTTTPSEEACAGKGGLAVRVPPTHAAPPTPPKRP